MEALAYTYSVLAWEEETPIVRDTLRNPVQKVNWKGATSALAIAASVNAGVSHASEINIPQSFQSPNSSYLNSRVIPSQTDPSAILHGEMTTPETLPEGISPHKETKSNESETGGLEDAIAANFAPPEATSAPLFAQKQSKPNTTQNPSTQANSSNYYPRPYYSRTKLPEELKISAFHLVYRAYSGGFRDSGIPSYGSLIFAAKTGKIEATDLIRAGIIQGRLTTQDLYDPGYVRAVQAHLKDLGK